MTPPSRAIFHRKPPSLPLSPRRPILRPIFVWPLAVVVFTVSAMEGIDRVALRQIDWPQPLASLQASIAPFDSTNAYGLFAVMTKTRPELIVEGSDNGVDWKEYAFKWKVGDVDRAPSFCEPHMPRLDWQFWFAALYQEGNANWMQNFAYRLLTGQPQVLKLLGTNPFPDHPPKYIRIGMYDYRFTTPAERTTSRAWWVRTPLRVVLPPMHLSQPRSPVDDSFRL